MIYKFRVILDAKEDIFRDIAIEKEATLEDLHNTIVNAFGFDGSEMASFYTCDDEWNQGEEISFSISPITGTEYKFYVNGALAKQGSDTTITFSTDPSDIDPLSNGDIITIGYTDLNGCEVDTSTISQTVTVNSLPTATLDPGIGSGTVCDGSEVTFTAGGGVEYEFRQAGILVQARSTSNTYTTSGLSNTQSITVTAFNANPPTAVLLELLVDGIANAPILTRLLPVTDIAL